MNTTNESPLVLLFSDHTGIYIPQAFAAAYPNAVSDSARKDLDNPDNEFYWETWATVLDTAVLEIEGVKYHLHQDGDLWAIRDGFVINDD